MLIDRVGKVEGYIAVVQEDVSEMRPMTDDAKRWKLVGLGAFGVSGFSGMAMGVTFADTIQRVGAAILGKLTPAATRLQLSLRKRMSVATMEFGRGFGVSLWT